jgi:integrase
MAMAFESAAKMARRGELVEATARDILNKMLEQVGASPLQAIPTVGACVNQWLEGQKVRTAKSTYLSSKTIATKFISFLGDGIKRPITALAHSDVQRFVDYLTTTGLAPGTVASNWQLLNGAFRQASRQGVPVPVFSPILPKVKSVGREVFSQAQIATLLSTAKGEMRFLILAGYYSGARLGDVVRMKWTDIDLTNGFWSFKQTKTSDKVQIPLHPSVMAELNKLASSDVPQEFVMPNLAKLDVATTSNAFMRLLLECGIDRQAEKIGMRATSKLSFHSLRHSFASALANSDVPPEIRMLLTGHRSKTSHGRANFFL